ncbi:MAG: UDP-N-acetylmuramoyl-L-alanyl-D-glutamate--2,6-diaminopimelate ligase [Desulfobacteraceae bacterium 4572_19]|nr:MAG: UDP-N-acetylmuramoyl-L-alanyl-D-glutamate--2,6-diaminopimelate ligase [Desulfobacteraceae bacterium 4572_19]
MSCNSSKRSRKLKLSTLLKECKLISSISEKELNLDINSIHTTAQTVKQGGLYIAIKGFSADGHHFIDEAVKRGATVIVADKLNTINSTVQHQNIKHNTNTVLSKTETIDTKNTIINSPCTVIVENSRKTAGIIAAQFYNNPSDNMIIVGVTGTNGKTTISYIIENIFKKAGLKTGVIGTINYRYNNKIFSNPMTTPDSLELQRILSEMQKNHVTHVVMEVSSHAIDLYRINGTKFDVKVFTNLTQDHLDYHKTMEHYWDCKRQFLTDNLNCNNYHDKLSVTTNNKTHGDTTSCKDFHKTIKKPYIVINTDDQHGKMLFNDLSKSLALFTPNNSSNSEDLSKVTCKTERIISTGTTFNTNIKSVDIISDINGITGTIKTPLAVFKFQSQLTGKFNLENILNAVGVAHCLNISPDFIKTGIETFAGTPGRLEQIHNANDRFIFIDYAHTPDALSNVLTTIKSMAPKKVICIFGCGGDRDNAKRPLMGKIAQQYSDITIITSDNPRSENPDTIINHILKGINPKEYHQYNKEDIALGITQKGFIIEPDRKKAIELGIQLSSPDDTILIAGKGHETYQIIGDKTIAFDDKTEASEAIAKIPITWSAKDILKATSADHICGSLSVKFSGIAIDSRTISPDMFFVAIKGDTFNG